MTTTTIQWVRAADRRPDDSTSVLLHTPQCDEPVWPGWWDSARQLWFSSDGENMTGMVEHWAEMPEPPAGGA